VAQVVDVKERFSFFAEPLCLIAPEFEPDRLPHCALPTQSERVAALPWAAVMQRKRTFLMQGHLTP
jgi:hypothetical protein